MLKRCIKILLFFYTFPVIFQVCDDVCPAIKGKVYMSTEKSVKFKLAHTEIAKANPLNTYKYFELLLTEILKHMEDKNLCFLQNLMPWSNAFYSSPIGLLMQQNRIFIS